MPGPADIQLQKAAMRARFQALRRDQSAERCRMASQTVCTRLDSLVAVRDAERLAGYASIRNEIDITPYLDVQRRRGHHVYLPRVVGPGAVEFVEVEDFAALVPGPFGIPEPVGPATPLERIEIFLVPGLAFDRQGTRLGFGLGYYDRILRPEGHARPLAIAIAYDWQVVDGELPSEPHDIPMDAIATDSELIICSDRLAPA
jgi:5-formyltetrahydrofolate cyclo-ligase